MRALGAQFLADVLVRATQICHRCIVAVQNLVVAFDEHGHLVAGVYFLVVVARLPLLLAQRVEIDEFEVGVAHDSKRRQDCSCLRIVIVSVQSEFLCLMLLGALCGVARTCVWLVFTDRRYSTSHTYVDLFVKIILLAQT